MQRGIGRDGTRLYPAMPFTSYTYMTDADALAIKAYLFTLPPVRAQAPAEHLGFPFNQRWLMAFWWRCSIPTSASARSAKSTEWNRGAYLAEALAHCGECHTPRNLALALDNRKKFAGAVTAGWHAYNITSDNGSGIGGWSDDEVSAYLSTGHAAGPRHGIRPDGRSRRPELQPVRPTISMRWSPICAASRQSRSTDLPATMAPPAPASTRKARRRTRAAKRSSRAPA